MLDLCKRSAPRAEVGRRALDTRPGARADRTTARAACWTDDSGSGEAFIISALAYTAKARITRIRVSRSYPQHSRPEFA